LLAKLLKNVKRAGKRYTIIMQYHHLINVQVVLWKQTWWSRTAEWKVVHSRKVLFKSVTSRVPSKHDYRSTKRSIADTENTAQSPVTNQRWLSGNFKCVHIHNWHFRLLKADELHRMFNGLCDNRVAVI